MLNSNHKSILYSLTFAFNWLHERSGWRAEPKWWPMILIWLCYATEHTVWTISPSHCTNYPSIYLFFMLVAESAKPVLDSYCLLTHKAFTGNDERMSSNMNVFNLNSLILAWLFTVPCLGAVLLLISTSQLLLVHIKKTLEWHNTARLLLWRRHRKCKLFATEGELDYVHSSKTISKTKDDYFSLNNKQISHSKILSYNLISAAPTLQHDNQWAENTSHCV